MTSSQSLRPAKLLRVASLVRSSPLISAAFSFDRNDSKGHRHNRYERITLFVETFIASDQIEEAKLSNANIPRSDCAAVGRANFSRCPFIFSRITVCS
jgi:hypothetical protein